MAEREMTAKAQPSAAPSERLGGGRAPLLRAVVPVLLGLAAAGVSITTLRLWSPILDEGAMLTGAAKLLRGGIFFREVDAFPLPGAWYLLAGAMAAFGESLVTARVLNAAIYTAMVVVSYLAARKVLRPSAAVLYGLSLIALKYWAWPVWSAYIYPDLAIALAMAGFLAFVKSLDGSTRWAPFAAGLLFGASAFTKQTAGIYPGLVALGVLAARGAVAARGSPAWSHIVLRTDTAGTLPYRPVKWYVAGGVVALGVPFIYFAAHGLGWTMIVNALIRPFTGYLPLSGLPYAKMLKLSEFGTLGERTIFSYIPPMTWIMIYLHYAYTDVWPREAALWAEGSGRVIFVLIPLAFAAGAALLARDCLIRRRWSVQTGSTLALFLLAAALFVSAFPRADYSHVINVGPAWLMAVFIAGDLLMRGERVARWWRGMVTAVMALGVAAALAGGVLMVVLMYRTCWATIELPRAGRMRVDPWQRQLPVVVDFIRTHTKPGDGLFVLGHEAFYYFVCERYSPWPFAQPFPGQTGPLAGRAVVEAIKTKPMPYVIQGDICLPGLPPILSYAPSLTRYVETHYREIDIGLEPPDHKYANVLERVR